MWVLINAFDRNGRIDAVINGRGVTLKAASKNWSAAPRRGSSWVSHTKSISLKLFPQNTSMGWFSHRGTFASKLCNPGDPLFYFSFVCCWSCLFSGAYQTNSASLWLICRLQLAADLINSSLSDDQNDYQPDNIPGWFGIGGELFGTD